MKWLIIGTSPISHLFTSHLKICGENPIAIYSRSKERAKAFAQEANLSLYDNDYEKLLTNVDAVYVASPNAIHYAQAKMAILAKKHVLVEKVMTDSFQKTQELFELAKANGVKIMEGYAHIATTPYQTIDLSQYQTLQMDLMHKSAKIKDQTFKTASTFNKATFGGVIPDMGVYPLSLAIYHFGTVKDIKLNHCEYLNGVLIATEATVVFQNQTVITKLSKLKNGDDFVYGDGKKLTITAVGAEIKPRFKAEIDNFVNGKNLDKMQFVSLEIARVIDLIKDDLFK